MNRQQCWVITGIVLWGAMLAGCGSWSVLDKGTDVEQERVTQPARTSDVDLTGVWEYEENHVVYTLNLDARGNGSYDWQGGRFETWSIANGVWRGAWFQPNNDREGEFALSLSDDHQIATGRWWYTRIGDDTTPDQPGGTFTLRRLEPIPEEEPEFDWISELEADRSPLP